MNKRHYKVIFSRVLNQLVVVSELAKSQGKAQSENVSSEQEKIGLFSTALSFSLNSIHFSLMLALGFVFLMPSVHAEDMAIRADKSASGNQQPIVLQTANGLPQVNIQTPSAGGVSRNQYSQFDVAEKGAVLNNARKAAQTQIAGWVQGNPNLARGEAKVILNEVNSANPSRLKGYVEVAGKKADVVIANPSGLQCDGCGVINAGRTTLTTGKVEVENGELKGYRVKGGKVTVGQKGMDNSQSDYTDIIADKAEIKGGVWSKKGIKVTTGKNNVDRTNDSVVYVGDENIDNTDRTFDPQSENQSTYSVDVSQLGGMYAEKIHLVDNGQGLGVRNAGHIGASAGEVKIDSQGRIVNNGYLQAEQRVQLTTQKQIENQAGGKILAHEGDILIQSKQDIAQSGVMSAKRNVAVKAKALKQVERGEIQGGAIELKVQETLTNRGLINSKGEYSKGKKPDLHIRAMSVENIGSGRIYGNRVVIGAKLIENKDELTPENGRQDAVIAAREYLTLGAEEIRNQTRHYIAMQQGSSTLYGEKGVTVGGEIDEDYQAQGKAKMLLNQSGTIESPSGAIQLSAEKVNNENLHFHAEIENQSNEVIDEHYIIPRGYKTEARIDYGLLKWISFSRAGKLAYRRDNINPLKEGEPIHAEHLLPEVNEITCQDYVNQRGCHIKPESIYNANHPAWGYFGIQPPTDMPAGLADINMPEEPIKPTEVEKPRKNRRETAESYAARLADYEKAVSDYRIALASYEQEKATYETRLKAYQQAIAPFKSWIDANEVAFDALQAKITEHNRRLLGKTFSDFWITKLNRRVIDESVVKTTLPGQILASGDISINAAQVLNNRSQIISGGQLSLSGDVHNEDETGYHILNEYGTSQWTYSRWRGGLKRYHQRNWGAVNAYNRNVESVYQMGVNHYKAQTDYHTHQQTQASQSGELLAKAQDALLPSSSLYRLNPEAGNVLIETDSAFTDKNQWLSSDYMFNALRRDPQNILRRLGDGYYEQRLVRDQVNQLTGRMFLTGYQDLEAQYKGLMDNGITFAKRFNLTPGVALSPAQVAQLTSDIVWFEEKEVTLPSGKQVKVMAPRVYAMAQKGDLNGEGALISADVIDLRSHRLINSGTIAGRKLTLLNTESLFNAGTITGDKVGINTTNNFDNIGGKVEAERELLVDVGGDLNHESTTLTTNVDLSHFQRSETTLARKALFHVKGEDGQLQLSSNNLNAKGADIINDGNGSTLVQSKNNMNLTALSVGFDEKMGKGNHYRHEKVEEAVVSRVKGKGNVALTAKNLRAEGAQLESEAKLMAIAENDLVLNGAKESRDFEEFHKTKSGSLARTTKTSLDQQHSVTQVGTQVSGKAVLLSAGHDVKAKGVQAIADDNLHIQAGHDVDIAADTNHFKNKHVETKKTSGVFTGGGIGITVGSKSEKHDYETEGWTQSDARSTLGSMNGNIRVSAGNHSNVMGTDMITPRTNRIDIEGAAVKVEAGKDIIERKEGHEYKQSGVTIALSTPVTDMAQAAYNSVKRSQQVTNGKLKALYAVKAAEEVGMAAQNVDKVAETLDALRAGNMQNTGTTSSPSVKISIGYGSQKQTQSSESQSISHQKSTVSTGTFNVKARDEKLTFEGVDANAKLMALSGKKGIEIKGVKDEEHQHTENKSAGGSVGVFVGTNGNSYGVGIEGSVNVAKGKSNSDSERWQNSHLQADKLITNSEAGNLSLDAANLNAKRWEADIQNLTVTSRQDTEKYESKQTGASASGSVAYGSGGGASVSASYNKAKVDYAQVNEQAGIRVGEDGMDAHIHNHTQLNGAIIESDADASKNHFKTKSLTHTDIENKSEIKTESASMSAGSGGVNPMQALSSALSLLGNTNESARSTTQSAISDNIQIETETPEKLTALSRDTKNANQRVEKQDLQKVQERQEMAKVIGDISNNAISIATYNEREKINKLSLEKFKAEEKYGKASTQAQEIGKQITAIQNDIDGTYGIGSKTGMAIRAVTAALQAAAQNDTAGSLVALASPYLNKTIHEMTAGDTAKDKATNLMAHALLSAVEFQVTGKDPLTGAVAGVTGEVTAQILTQAIYNKTPNQLTANEKENISTLSQLSGGLAAALTAKANGTTAEQGGSFIAATSGAETAKRAVENNFLSDASRARLNELKTKYHRGEKLTNKEKLEFRDLIESDQRSDVLLDKFRKDPNSLNSKEREAFLSYVDRYYIETVTGNTASGYKLASPTSPVNAKNRFESEYLINDPVPKRDYGHFPFAGTDTQRSQAVNTLPEESKNWLGWRSEKHSRDEEMYYTVKNELDAPENYKNSSNGKIAYSVKDGLELGSTIYGGLGVLKGAKKINDVMSNSTKFTLGIAGAGSVGAQLMSDGTVDPRSLAIDLVTAYALKGKGFGLTVGGNAASGALNNYITDKSMSQGAISSGIGSAIGYGMGKAIEVPLDKKINLDRTWAKYNLQPLNDKIPYVDVYRRNIIPSISGSTMSEIGNRVFQNYYTKPNEEK
ncbi:hemagglutinin repeat-containing protein [Haemophilus haemolyticus]|uniref:two-partner secretion domain-containing protein n=1 Tax=Haemophilus haemolyticus TaxID=726 RepID=UPI000E58BC2D|nr:hemagglutinin repeat-containing protein [Haemophilus haemolyticus]